MPQGAVCVGQARALEVHVHSEFTSLPMALLFSSGKGLARLFLEQGSLFLLVECRKLSLATQPCLRFVSSYELPGFVKSWRHPKAGTMSQVTSSLMAHLEDISWAWANVLLTAQETFFSHELTYLPPLYQELPLWERRHQRLWSIVTMLDEGRKTLSPILAPPTPLWCVNSCCLLTLGFHSKLSLLAHALEQEYPGKESIREYWPTCKQSFVFAHCLKQLMEYHHWNCRQKETLQDNASSTRSLTGMRT